MTILSAQPSPRADDAASLGLAPLAGFRPDIQVLRGVAVLLVVLYHAEVLAPGGFVGVDVFFVISGYVIGRRLVAGFASGRGGLAEFSRHRVRRILPALSVMLVTVILAAPLLAPVATAKATSRTGVAAALFSANLYLYQEGTGYAAAAAKLNPLLHTWSLSVEEQLYLLVPVLLLAAWRVSRRHSSSLRNVRIALAALLAASFALCVVCSRVDSVWGLRGLRLAFFSPFTRAWEFAVGLALVVLPASWIPSRRWRPVLLVVGAASVAYAALLFSDTMRFPGTSALIPVAGAALLIHAGTRAEPGAPAPPRAVAPLRALGDMSYSWYLWHWPLIVFAAALWPNAGRVPLVAAAVVSLLPARWSLRWIERRFVAASTSRPRSARAVAVVCIVAPLIAAVVAIPIREVVEDATRTELSVLSPTTIEETAVGRCNRSTPARRATSECTWGDPDGPPVVLVGDSNAAHYGEALIGAATSSRARLDVAWFAACPFVDVDVVFGPQAAHRVAAGTCERFVRQWIAALERDPPTAVVIGIALDAWVDGTGLAVVDPASRDVVTDPGQKARVLEDSLTRVVRRLRDAGSEVALIEVAPKATDEALDCSRLAILVDATSCLPGAFSLRGREQPATANAILRRAAARGGGSVWSFTDEICPHSECRPLRRGRPVWRDQGHISPAMARMLVPSATRQLRATLAGRDEISRAS